MANETQIGQLIIDLKVKTEALEKGLETAKQKLEKIEQENKKVQSSNGQLDASYLAMSATAVLALGKIVGAIKECVNEYNSYTQAMSSLQNVSEYTGQSMQDLSEIMNKFGAYMTKADLATTIKNFSLMGFTAEQTEQMIEALTNSAIRNRNANYTVSEAVRVASEGYRQGLSTLSDSAGVTENLSVMLDNYAKSIGKTASQLTDAEKNQAYLNRTMYAAEPFAGAMADYMDTLAGKQGQYSQAMRETQVAYAEAIEPLLIKFEEFKTKTIAGIGDIISANQSATVGVTTFGVAILSLGTLFTAGIKGVQLYKKAIDTLNVSSATLKSTMTGMLVFSAVIAGITALTTAIQENEKATAKLEEITRRYNEVKNGTFEYTDKNVASLENDRKAIEEQIELYNKIEDAQKQYDELPELSKGNYWLEMSGDIELCEDGTVKLKKSAYELKQEIKNAEKAFDEAQKTNGNYGNSLKELQESQKENAEALKKADTIKNINNLLDTESIKNKKREAAQAVNTAESYQELFRIYQQGKKGTKEYENAVTELEKKFPEAVNANGIMAKDMKILIDKMAQDAGISWDNTQTTIQERIDNITKAIANCSPEIDVNGTYAKSVAEKIGIPTNEVINTLQTALNLYNMLLNKDSTQVGGGKSSYTAPKTSYSSSSTYQNKALDNYKKQIEHKKALDQISIQQEISMYKTALRKYAKTADEKNEIREKIYELNKELAQKEKELLEQQTEDYENYIQDQKNAKGAAYDINEQTADYNKIIQMHRKYLKQIMKDERLSLDERKEIYREELDTIRDYEQQKRDLRVEQIDNTVTQLTNAITKQLEEMQEKDKSFIDAQIEEVEKLKEIRINAINAEYDAKIEAIEKELEALDKAEQQKSRDEEDAEYERKKNRLQQLIDYEHDATTKANYQKELDKLVAEYQKTLDSRTLEDKKEALNAQKDLLKEEQDDKTQAIEDETDKQKELYNKQLEDLEDYYSKQIDKAQETAEKMLLNVEQNQDKILSLLKSYGDAYEITGQTLGEKLAQGINEGITNKIENMIQRVQDSINAGIENKIKEWTSGMYRYEEGSNKPQTQTINVYQTNNIEQNPEMPSETYRKLRNIDEQLASGLAGM